jgi:hypothetical protein
MMEESTSVLEITAQVVEKRQRTDSLYRAFGPFAHKAEAFSYSVADKLIAGYTGGDWDYVELSNGGMFAFMDDERFLLQSMNGSEFELSGEAAGLTVWLFATSWGSEVFEGNQDLQSALVRNYDLLRDYICQHKEASKILALCD